MNTKPSAVEVTQLNKSYLKNHVLRDLSFSVAAGETFGFAGGNGAGKSTFLKCLLDFCHYQSGDISIFGTSAKNRLARRHLAFLPERFIPPYYLDGRQFLQLIAKLQAVAYNEDEARAMLDSLDLDQTALSKSVRSFSKGMTQKLGLAACFLAKRDLYILDEPMSGLDPKARALVKRQFVALQERGATLFFTSHALADIDEVCERMAILHGGTIRHIGKPSSILERFPQAKTLEEAYLHAIEASPNESAAPAAKDEAAA